MDETRQVAWLREFDGLLARVARLVDAGIGFGPAWDDIRSIVEDYDSAKTRMLFVEGVTQHQSPGAFPADTYTRPAPTP